MTPTEMAEWLDKVYGYIKRKHSTTEDEAIRDRVVAWLRAQPTDAQKVEALQAERLAVMCRMGGALDDEFCQHGEALRLLGLSDK